MKKGLVVAALAGVTAISASAFPAKGTYPIFDNQRLERPQGMRQVSAADFKIDLKRVAALDRPTLLGAAANLRRFGEFLATDPQGRKLWERAAEGAAATVNRWDFNRKGFGANRYIYNVGQLRQLSLMYTLTGNRELGDFLRGHILQIARLPIEFWLHSELRGYNREKPCGALETSSVTGAMAAAMSLVGDELFSPAERKEINAAIRNKGFIPLRNWLEVNAAAVNNFVAVIATGYLQGGRYFNDEAAVKYAIQRLRAYLDKSIEDDGSYGEGSGYLSYPMTTMLPAAVLLTPEERRELYGSCGFKNSSKWLAYLHFFNREADGSMKRDRMLFSDNGGGISNSLYLLAAHCYQDPLAVYIGDMLNSKNWQYDSFATAQLSFMLGLDQMPAGKSPEELKLPLVSSFSSGESFIRSGWEPDSVVLGMMRSCRVKTGNSHRHPESNSIAMGAFGEYFIVLPGSASYRSPIHKDWDCSTRSANTVLVDGQNQRAVSNSRTKFLMARQFAGFDLLAQDAARSYRTKLSRGLRAVVYLRDIQTFVVIDDFKAASGDHSFETRLHFFNRDKAAEIKELGKGRYLIERPLANLAVAESASRPIEFSQTKGYMHTLGSRDYSPGGPGEGFSGSSLGLYAKTVDKVNSVVFFTVLQPLRKDARALPVEFSANSVKVGEKMVKLVNGSLEIGGERVKLY